MFEAGGSSWPVSRAGVFAERATALYLPPRIDLVVVSVTPLEAVLISTPAAGGDAAVLITPEQVRVNARGRANYAREVHDIFVTDPHVRRLMVGETFNPPGHWSSFPPHKHDGRDGEPILEEVYYYRVDPPQGFGQQMRTPQTARQ
jgi:5-deoxy-glucuronate isomerase